MQIHNQPDLGPRPVRPPTTDLGIDLTRPNRDGIEVYIGEAESARAQELAARRAAELSTATREAAGAPPKAGSGDRVEVSPEARLLLSRSDAGAEAAESHNREQRVGELRQAYQEGRLNTPERVDRAATRLLAGE